MEVIQFTFDEVNYVNLFLAYDKASRDAFLVDCGAFGPEIVKTIEKYGLNLKFLLLTHSHYDHVDGLAEFKKTFSLPIYAAEAKFGTRVTEEDTIPFAGKTIRIFATPGHTTDSLAYFVGDAVFAGDAIFSGAVGGTSDTNTFWQQNQHVRNKILSLPAETRIFCGHGAPSVVGVERLYNPFFT